MALFKIEKGLGTTLATKRPNTTEGYCYFTTDDGKFYIDIATGTGTSKRIVLNAYAADKLSTARNLQVSLSSTSAASFDGSANVTTIGVAGTLDVANGGTGRATLTSGYALLGNGTGAVSLRAITNNTTATAVSASTNLITANTLYYHKGNSNIVTVGTITSGTWNGTTVGVAYGGTGKTSWTQYGLLYASASTTLNSLGVGTSGYVLSSKGSTAAPEWIAQSTLAAGTAAKFASAQSVTLTGDVTGTASSQAGWSVATTLANSGVTAGSYGPSSNTSPAHGGTFYVPYITFDAKGRATAASTKTITLPSYSVFGPASASTAGTAGLVPAPAKGAQGYFLRGDGTWYNFLDLNNTALDTISQIKAAWESADGTLKSTLEAAIGAKVTTGSAEYLKGLSISGRTITYTKGDGTTGTLTTQDNNTNYYHSPSYTSTASTTTTGGSSTNIKIATGTGVNDLYIPTATGSSAGVTIVYPAASCTTFSSDSGTCTPLAVQKAFTLFLKSGTANGTIQVTNGSNGWTTIAVGGLGSAAYTNSSAYATAAQGTKADNAVPNTRTVNGKALSSNISLTYSDVGAAASSHTHDDRYYTETETNTKLNAKLDKLTYEWNKEYSAGGTAGYLLIGSFPMYDTNVTIDIDATTNTTYHGTVVIATQNVSTTSIGSAKTITVYGDPTGTISDAIRVTWSSGSRNYNVYFSPSTWSKNLIHIRAMGQYLDAIDETKICTQFTAGTAPATTSGLTVVNALTSNFNYYTHPTTAGNKHIPSGGSSGQILRWSAAGTAAWGADSDTTYSAGTGLSLSGTTFSLGASGATAGSYGPSSASTLSHSGSFYVPYVTVDAYGRVTGISTKTYTLPASGNTDTKVTTAANTTTTKLYVTGCTGATTGTLSYNANVYINCSTGVLYGAAWNDYAEYRWVLKDQATDKMPEPGRCVVENGNDSLSTSNARLQPGAKIISDTYGMCMGETEKAKTPIAVCGRVLAYPFERTVAFNTGDAVCSGPNGTVSKMTREEIMMYPERIIGTVVSKPTYKEWGPSKIPVNGRIWIQVR